MKYRRSYHKRNQSQESSSRFVALPQSIENLVVPVEKIRALLARCTSSNEHEARNAAIKAYDLIKIYGVDLQLVAPTFADDGGATPYDTGFTLAVRAAETIWKAEGLEFTPYVEPEKTRPGNGVSRHAMGPHVNETTGEAYRGTHNQILLEMACMAGGWYERQWAGFNQWKKAGKPVRAGEHGTKIFVFAGQNQETGRVRFVMQTVFNVNQTVQGEA